MLRSTLGILSIACALVAAAPARAEGPPPFELPPTLTLKDALRIFHERGLDLLLADANVAAAEGDVRIAHQVYNPGWSVMYGHMFNYDPAVVCNNVAGGPGGCSAESITVGLSDSNALEDALVGKRGLRIDVAEAALKAAKMSRLDAERTLAFNVKQAYFASVQARALRDFSRDALEAANKTLELNQLKYKAGAISEADVAKVETAKLEAEQQLDGTEQALRLTKVQLAFLLGYRGAAVPDFSIEADLIKFQVPPQLGSATPQSLYQAALDHRPDLAAIKAQEERARASIASQRRQRFPDVSLTVQYYQQGTSQFAVNPPTLLFTLSGTLPVFYQLQGEVAKAEADFRAQNVTEAKLQAQVTADVNGAFAAWQNQRKLVERMESVLLERAKRARDLVAVQYEKGAASLLEFLDAQRTYIATNVEYFQDLTNYWTAVFQLETAVGEDLR